VPQSNTQPRVLFGGTCRVKTLRMEAVYSFVTVTIVRNIKLMFNIEFEVSQL
jgi:hypothetical protein